MYTTRCALRIAKQLYDTGVFLDAVHDDLLQYYVRLCCQRSSLYPHTSRGNTLLENLFEQDLIWSLKMVSDAMNVCDK